jgi:hypothetical protein
MPLKLTPQQTPAMIKFFFTVLRSLGSWFTMDRIENLERMKSRKEWLAMFFL